MTSWLLFVLHGFTRMLVNNPALPGYVKGRFVWKDTHLRQTGAARVRQGYSLPAQTSFPRTKTTTREPDSP